MACLEYLMIVEKKVYNLDEDGIDCGSMAIRSLGHGVPDVITYMSRTNM